MNEAQQEIVATLNALPPADRPTLRPAGAAQVALFSSRAVEKGVPATVVQQLADFYAVANELAEDNMLGFFSCDDIILFEWWPRRELWLGQRHFYTVRWSEGRFCLGDASNVSFSEADTYATLADLLTGCVQKINEISRAAESAESDDD